MYDGHCTYLGGKVRWVKRPIILFDQRPTRLDHCLFALIQNYIFNCFTKWANIFSLLPHQSPRRWQPMVSFFCKISREWLKLTLISIENVSISFLYHFVIYYCRYFISVLFWTSMRKLTVNNKNKTSLNVPLLQLSTRCSRSNIEVNNIILLTTLLLLTHPVLH